MLHVIVEKKAISFPQHPTVICNSKTCASAPSVLQQHSFHKRSNLIHWLRSLFRLVPFAQDPIIEEISQQEEIQTLSQIFHVPVKKISRFLFRLVRSLSVFPEALTLKIHVGSLTSRYGAVVKQIGQGTGGTVYILKNNEGKYFAAKEFRKKLQHESWEKYAENFLSEYCVGLGLHHPNIIETVDLITDPKTNKCFEVMEGCGMDLFKYIQKGKYGLPEVYCCFKQMINGVAYLHQNGIAHRDLKPENICFSFGSKLKIIDFGLSFIFKQEKKCRGLCGSSPYIAPEEWTQKEYDAAKVDVWSCGIIYLTLLFHAFPVFNFYLFKWECARPTDQNYKLYLKYFEKKQLKWHPLFQRLENEPFDLLTQMLHPNPKKRISIQDILKNEWFRSIEVCHHNLSHSGFHQHEVN